MTFRDNAIEALRAGQNAGLNDPNPYRDADPLLARVWMKGYESMLTLRVSATPARQVDRAAAPRRVNLLVSVTEWGGPTRRPEPGAGHMHKKFGRHWLYLPNDDAGDQGGGADGAGAGGGAGAGDGGDTGGDGAGNAGGKGKSKRDPLYADLPDDHPLVKRHEALKEENKNLRPKARIVDEAEEAKKTDAQKIADLQSKIDGQPALVAAELRDHLVELHGIEEADAELFLTGATPELIKRQVAALLDKAGGANGKRRNYVKNEGGSGGKPGGPNENASFAKDLFGGGDSDD